MDSNETARPGAEFVSEELTPVAATGDPAGMARGEPGLPGRFAWRGREYRVVRVIKQWKSSGPCRNGSDELYLRKHWFQFATDPPAVMTVYFDRQARNRRRPKARWFLYTISEQS
jgi:hypothetical protein